MKNTIFILLFVCFLSKEAVAQQDSLRWKVAQISQKAKGIVGVAVTHLEKGDTFTLNGNVSPFSRWVTATPTIPLAF